MANLQRIKELCEQRKVQQKDLAEAIGVTPQTIIDLVRRNSTKTDILERVAKFFGVSMAYFFDEPLSTTTNNQVHHGTGDNNIVSAQAHEIELLKDLVAEKERTIQILLDKK